MLDDAYQLLINRVKSGEIPFEEAEECASVWGALGTELYFFNVDTGIIQEYMEGL